MDSTTVHTPEPGMGGGVGGGDKAYFDTTASPVGLVLCASWMLPSSLVTGGR